MNGPERKSLHLRDLTEVERQKRIEEVVAASWYEAGTPPLSEEMSDRIRARLSAAAESRSAATIPGTRDARIVRLRAAAIALPLAAAAAVALLVVAPWGEPQRVEGRRVSSLAEVVAAKAPRHPSKEPTPPTANETEIRSPADGSTTSIDLPGLGRLVLLDGAVARLATAGDHVALALESGAVVAEVEKRGPERAFFVTTAAGRVEVVGTVFGVAVEDGGILIAVTEGRVRVTAADEGGIETIVDAGEELELGVKATGPREITARSRERIGRALGLPGGEAVSGTGRIGKGHGKGSGAGGPAADPDGLFERAEALLKAGREAEALAAYERILKLADPERKADAAFAIGQIRYRSGDAAACEKAFAGAMPLFIGTSYETGARGYLSRCRSRLRENSEGNLR